MIYNVPVDAFGPLGTRNGDLIAICNIIEWMRKEKNDPSIQFFLASGVLNKEDYIQSFYSFLCNKTDYFTKTPGKRILDFHNVSVWDIRDIIGDCVTIKNDHVKQKKVVIFPVYDAQYNIQRNWSMDIMGTILNECREKYPDHQKIICSKDIPPEGLFDHTGFKISTDFMTNIGHIMDAEVFYGGDTGVSHFASVLEPGPELNYIYSSRCLIHTLPFYFLSERKGNLRTFWLDFVGGARWKI